MTDEDMACELALAVATDEEIAGVLKDYTKVAVVGLSPKPERASYRVAKYLMDNGYSVYPVNPMEKEILGVRSSDGLKDVPDDVEIVDIFRKPGVVLEIVEQAIEKGVKVIWMQEGIVNNEASRRAEEAGLKVIMDKCMMKEHKTMKARD